MATAAGTTNKHGRIDGVRATCGPGGVSCSRAASPARADRSTCPGGGICLLIDAAAGRGLAARATGASTHPPGRDRTTADRYSRVFALSSHAGIASQARAARAACATRAARRDSVGNTEIWRHNAGTSQRANGEKADRDSNGEQDRFRHSMT